MKNWFGTGLELYFEFQIGLDIIQNYKTPKLRFFAKSPLQVLEIH